MQVIFGLSRVRRYKKPVVALGVFDGVHLAHRQILEGAVKKARQIMGTSIAFTFWPHPQGEATLYSLEHRLRLIAELGTDVCIVARFNKLFANISAEDFIKKILVSRIHPDYVYVGINFRFGHLAEGGHRLLERLSGDYNFRLKLFRVFRRGNKTISSTYIRRLILRGDLPAVRGLLCRPVSVLGTVIRGDALGKKIGFPTANINPHHEILPPSGVYAVKVLYIRGQKTLPFRAGMKNGRSVFRFKRTRVLVRGASLNGKMLTGLCYIGSRPTFKRRAAGKKEKNIEVHILDFNKNIYRQYLEIQFIKHIRRELRFSSQSALVEQIKKDIKRARQIFSRH